MEQFLMQGAPILMITTVALAAIFRMKQRIRGLEYALVAKRVLLGKDEGVKGFNMVAGDTLELKSNNGVRLATITVTNGTCTIDASVVV